MAEPASTTSPLGWLLERSRFFKRLGLETFLGKRDISKALGYEDTLTTAHYRTRYRRGGLAGRIVDVFPKATWRGGAEIIEDENPEVFTPFEQACDALIERLNVWSTFYRADRLAGLAEYSVILIGAPGKLSDELPRGTKQEDILFLQPFGQDDISIETWDIGANSPRFGQPITYKLKRTSFNSPDLQVPVHWTRIIHIAEDTLDDTLFGLPRLERPWNRLDDLEKVTGGGAEAFWMRANQGVHFDMDKDMDLDEEEKQKVGEKIDAYEHNMSRIIRTRGVKAETLGSDVADFSRPADAIITQIAGMLAIPKRILTGSEMGQLASGQDRDNWDTQVSDRRLGYAGPMVVKPFINRLIAYGYLPQPKTYDVRWPEMMNLTQTERAEGAKAWATTNQANPEIVFTSEEIRDKWYGMEPLKPEETVKDKSLPQDAEDNVAELEAAIRKGGNVTIMVKPSAA